MNSIMLKALRISAACFAAAAVFCSSPFDRATSLGSDVLRDVDPRITDLGAAVRMDSALVRVDTAYSAIFDSLPGLATGPRNVFGKALGMHAAGYFEFADSINIQGKYIALTALYIRVTCDSAPLADVRASLRPCPVKNRRELLDNSGSGGVSAALGGSSRAIRMDIERDDALYTLLDSLARMLPDSAIIVKRAVRFALGITVDSARIDTIYDTARTIAFIADSACTRSCDTAFVVDGDTLAHPLRVFRIDTLFLRDSIDTISLSTPELAHPEDTVLKTIGRQSQKIPFRKSFSLTVDSGEGTVFIDSVILAAAFSYHDSKGKILYDTLRFRTPYGDYTITEDDPGYRTGLRSASNIDRRTVLRFNPWPALDSLIRGANYASVLEASIELIIDSARLSTADTGNRLIPLYSFDRGDGSWSFQQVKDPDSVRLSYRIAIRHGEKNKRISIPMSNEIGRLHTEKSAFSVHLRTQTSKLSWGVADWALAVGMPMRLRVVLANPEQ